VIVGPYMAARVDRSRSPNGCSEWISRQVASFARYPAKRPTGLWVDSTGAFRLSVLMSVWGRKQGLTEQQVFSGLQKHKFHENSGSLRFAMSGEPAGDLTIRVHRRKDGVMPGQEQAGLVKDARVIARIRPRTVCGDATVAGATITPDHRAGGVKVTPGSTRWSDHTDGQDQEVWDRYHGWHNDTSWGAKEFWKTGRKIARSKWQTADNWHERSGWQDGESWERSSHDVQSNGEKVQRWLSYVLKGGCEKLGISVDQDGWASVDELANALHHDRPYLEIAESQELRDLLRDTDLDGRFELDELGRLRKVDREARRPRKIAPSSGIGTAASAPGELDSERDGGSGEPSATIASVDTANPDMPEKPPGDHWTKYIDDDTIWWYYEGPKGKWWTQNTDEPPQLWTEDD